MLYQPLVSIIIPTYNRAHLIGETLDSVLAQTYTDWECIVVDDGSTDGTSELMHNYCSKDLRFQYHQRPANRLPGGNAARNYGFELSKGEYVNWFDDDDIMLDNFIQQKMNLFDEDLIMVICAGANTDEKLEIINEFNLTITSFLFKDYLFWKLKIITNSIMFKKSYLINKELFRDGLTRGQETEFFSRLFFRLEKQKFKILNDVLFLYRQHVNSKTTNDQKYNPYFIKSKTFIMNQNLIMGKKLKDFDIINKTYFALITYYFESLKNKDFANSENILKSVLKECKNLNYQIYIEILFFGNLFNFLERGSYKFEKRWKNFKF